MSVKLNPWIHHVLLGFAVFNLVIGSTLFFYYPKIPFTVISPFIPQSAWASIFLVTGLSMLYGLYKKIYGLLYYLMILGLFIKACWEIGLLLRIQAGGTLFSAELWGMIAYLQLLGVIYFKPEYHGAV